jgi:hypothetical protein
MHEELMAEEAIRPQLNLQKAQARLIAESAALGGQPPMQGNSAQTPNSLGAAGGPPGGGPPGLPQPGGGGPGGAGPPQGPMGG